MAPLLQREGIDVSVTAAPDIQNVLADKLQVQQVLTNLISNATEAMAQEQRRMTNVFRLVASQFARR